jgi:hypothetical protein
MFPNTIIHVLKNDSAAFTFTFPLDCCAAHPEKGVCGILSRLSAPPVPQAAETPTNSTKKGSFYYDWERGGYLMEWSSPTKFEAWHQEEKLTYSIELIASSTVHGHDGGL